MTDTPNQTTRVRRYWSAHRLPLLIMSAALLLDAASATTVSPFYWANAPALLVPAILAWVAMT